MMSHHGDKGNTGRHKGLDFLAYCTDSQVRICVTMLIAQVNAHVHTMVVQSGVSEGNQNETGSGEIDTHTPARP